MRKAYHPQYQFYIPSHHPVGIDGDALSYAEYARAICELITNATDENIGLTIGIFGQWGMGKSSLLLMVRDLLSSQKSTKQLNWIQFVKKWTRWIWQKRNKRAKRLSGLLHQPEIPKPFVVMFDAWKYGQGEAMWIGLLRTITNHIDEHLHVWTTVRIKWRLWLHRVMWRKFFLRSSWLLIRFLFAIVLFYIGLIFIQQALSQPNVTSLLPWLQAAIGVTSATTSVWALLSGLLEILINAIRAILRTPFDLPSDLLRQTLLKRESFAFETFHQDLVDIIQSLGHPVVVLIDDLDRCPADQIVPVLEAIKHFDIWSNPGKNRLKSNRFATITFVLAADRRAIERAVLVHFNAYQEEMNGAEQQAFAREYLEKIVQVPFELPPLASRKFGEFLDIRSSWNSDNEGSNSR